MTARYEAASTQALGDTRAAELDNEGIAAARDWTVIVTLSAGSRFASASGAEWRQDGQAVTSPGHPYRPDNCRP
ncbi:hypothetical protein OG799_10510 [Micromonospora sp. NBC_00898]|uniref:hypothetical protein n=1 Tax=Micromonospora sp. NBC_00898 TaxID=2975981 RepID=UPI0038680F25|nr:hypothetical protein OG799_10510 [Micromonospora sp. NBC_00898]